MESTVPCRNDHTGPKQGQEPESIVSIRVSPEWSRTLIEFSKFSKFRESDKSLKHELDSI